MHELRFALESIRIDLLCATFHHTHHYIACSTGVRDCLHTRFGIPEDRIDLVHEFISTEHIQLRPSPEGNRLHIGNIANMDYRKGIDLFVDKS